MSELDFSIEPEVEALIREIAKDPRSSFFQVERPRSPRGLIQSWEPYSPSSAGWTAAERHLMSAYREEVAYCLRWKILLEGARLRPVPLFIDHRQSLRDTTCLPSASHLEERARSAAEAAARDGEESEAETIERVLEGRALSASELYELSLMSVRLAPTDTAWLRLFLALCLQGDPHSAIDLLGARQATAGSDLMRSYMWENLGCAYSILEHHDLARDAYRRACAIGATRVAPLCSFLYQAVLSGDRRTTELVGGRIDEQVDVAHPALTEFAANLLRARAAGLWTPTPEALRISSQLESSHGQSTRTIAAAMR